VSIQAISWALKQPIAKSSEKFVLVVLCNYADERGYCYPSIAALAADTAQDRKTVIANLKSLSTAGVIRDTGKRVGATGQIIVYQINSAENGIVDPHHGKACYYSYRLTNQQTGQFYVGIRTFVGEAKDDSYMGSGRWPTMCANSGITLQKEIIREYASWKEAQLDERHLIDEGLQNPLCMNSPKTGTRPKNGTIQTVPVLTPNSTVFPSKQSQKRDTDPSGTIKEPPEELTLHDSLPRDAWEEWIAHRRERRMPMSPRALKPQLKLLAKFDTDTQREIIETSMQAGWQGLFAPKGKKAKPAGEIQWM